MMRYADPSLDCDDVGRSFGVHVNENQKRWPLQRWVSQEGVVWGINLCNVI